VKLSENEPLFLLQRMKRREGQAKLCSQQNEESFHNIPNFKALFFGGRGGLVFPSKKTRAKKRNKKWG
jgi:hypothetical protein